MLHISWFWLVDEISREAEKGKDESWTRVLQSLDATLDENTLEFHKQLIVEVEFSGVSN